MFIFANLLEKAGSIDPDFVGLLDTWGTEVVYDIKYD